MLVLALLFKGFAHLVDFLACAYDHLGFRHHGRQFLLQCLEQLLLAQAGLGYMAGYYFGALRMNQFHDTELFEFAQALFHRDFQ